jgi:type I restriction enzyme S subunit
VNDAAHPGWSRVRVDWLMEEVRESVAPEQLAGREVFHYSIPALAEYGDGIMESGDSIESAKPLLKGGELLVSKLNPRKGHVLQAHAPVHPTVCSGEFVVLNPRNCDVRFMFHLFSSEAVRQHLDARAQSVTKSHQRVGRDDIAKLWVLVPNTRKQGLIAEFLDREIGRIDRILLARARLLALLEARSTSLSWMAITGENLPDRRRTSGLPWLGSVPALWSIAAVSSQFEVRLGRMLNPERSAGHNLAPYVRNANIRWDSVDVSDIAEMDFPPQERRRYRLKPGDVLINEGGAGMGRTAIWNGEIEECYLQKSVIRLRPLTDSNPKWIVECMRVAVARRLFLVDGNVATIPHLPAETLRTHRFPFPSRDVQERQLDWLDKQRGRTALLAQQVQRQIRLVRERREVLITAAVNGQIDIAADAA